ncbi:MAG: DUF4381 family protein [Akkermansiaceae bacterium]|nr:DUF4381 family protein [Akkermansiaceae bacterium]
MAEETPSFELKEPAPPEPLLPADPAISWWLALLLGALVIAALCGWYHWRKRRTRKTDPQVLRQQAYQEARTAFDRIDCPTSRGAAVQLSLVLRRYLAAAAMDSSLYETHEEFISRSDSLENLTEAARAACHSGFTALATVKYSPLESAPPPATLLADARELLETLHLGFNG